MSSRFPASACFALFAAARTDVYDSRIPTGSGYQMTQLICFILSCYGVTNIVTSGKIFQWLRDLLQPIPVLGYWIKCPMCLSVLVGIGWFILGLSPQIDAPFLVSAASCGMISSGSCWILRVALHRLGEDEL